MAQELERKVLCDQAEFLRCLSVLRDRSGQAGDAYVQVNYYFDTPDGRLAAAHSMLRVRRKRDGLYLQYKTKRTRTGDLLLCEEEEASLQTFPPAVDPSRFFPSAPACNCILLGDLVTHRTDFSFPGAVVSCDESFYFGKVDFEIEIEGEAHAIEAISEWLCPRGICEKGNGKFSRFYREYQDYSRLTAEGRKKHI